MKITHMGHCGFMAELAQEILIFDYYRGEIPEVDWKKQVYFFSRSAIFFMRHTDTKLVYPMHYWEDPGVISTLLDMEVSAPYRDRIVRTNVVVR